MSLTRDQIDAMPDEWLRQFLDEQQGVRLPSDSPRSLLLSKLHSVALVARDI